MKQFSIITAYVPDAVRERGRILKHSFIYISLFVIVTFAGCGRAGEEKGIKVTTTIFPLYDFAREVGGDRVSVKMMLPPGSEAHSYEPTPGDIVRLNESSLFIYIGESMEPWADDILHSVQSGKLKVLRASEGIVMIKSDHDAEHGEDMLHDEHGDDGHHHGEYDPHIWLDFSNDIKIVNRIADALSGIDPQNSGYYKGRAHEYTRSLDKLDSGYKKALAHCTSKTIIYGGHFAFGYMAKRYGLEYISPYSGFSPDAEPSPKNIAALEDRVRKSGAKYIYYEELVEPRVARAVASETGTGMMMLDGAHNVTKDEMVSGKRFIDIMYENLEKLKTGLGCAK